MKALPGNTLRKEYKLLNSLLAISMLCMLILGACEKEPPASPPPVVNSGKSVLVLNEGNFGWGNASLDLIDLQDEQVHEDVFQTVNHRPLGDVLQSICMVDDEAWLVVNNSMKIEKINLQNFQSTGTIQGLQSPRHLLPLEDKVYASDLYANRIHIIDKSSGKLKGSIPCDGWTEALLMVNSEVWVSNVEQGKLYVINKTNDQIIDSVKVGDAPRWMTKDHKGQIWVLCEGKIPPGETAGTLWKIDPASRTGIESFSFPPGSHPSQLRTNVDGTILYFLFHGINKMSTEATELPTSPWVSQGSRLFYGLEVNHHDQSLWVSDARDYVQRGEVLRYSDSGEKTGVWKAGVIPAAFYFY